MDSGPSPSSLSSVTTKDEFEGLEVAEFDANVLWELLHDEPREEDAGHGGVAPKQAMEVIDLNLDSVDESYWCLNNDDNNNSNNDIVQDLDWFRIMEETSLPCTDMWYEEPCMEEINQILESGDCSFSHTSHTAILSDDIGYIGLWHDS